jgi:uncharacterized protein with HEPN domain
VIDRNRLFLTHIFDAVDDIAAFTAGGRADFMADRKTQSAVIRQLEIIGEAAKNLDLALVRSETSVPWRQIAGTGDRLIHAYFRVDLDAVWSMVEQDVPALRREVARILQQLSPG